MKNVVNSFDKEIKELGEKFKKGEISEHEFIDEAVKLMIKYNVKIHATAPFSSVEILREDRER